MNFINYVGSERDQTIESVVCYEGQTNRQVWEGHGAAIEFTSAEGLQHLSAFVLQRLDDGPDKPRSRQDIVRPTVLRCIDLSAPDRITDYVFYEHESQAHKRIAEYKLPRVIPNFGTYLFSPWLQPDGHLTSLQAGCMRSIARTTLAKPGSRFSETLKDKSAVLNFTYANVGALPFEDLGTPPYYPVEMVRQSVRA
ncbi:MAG: hypothetical protein JWM81_91 [Candidatus Saccharibacteria bacterium]|nr:hypothetical protein [Candidatus Saccharibacteria bacterium]